MIKYQLFFFVILITTSTISCQTLEELLIEALKDIPDDSSPSTPAVSNDVFVEDISSGDESPGSTAPNTLLCNCVNREQCAALEEPKEDPFLNLVRPKQACTSSEICCESSNIIRSPVQPSTPSSPPNVGCGFVNFTGFSRTHQGRFALEGEFPWFTAILKDGSYECPGSLIHPQIVLTTAHRMINVQPGQLKIRIGDANLSNSPPFEERNVQEIVLHPDYDRKRLYYDVSLLILEFRIPLGLGISTICLPMRNKNFFTDCISGGWGSDQDEIQSPGQERLKKVSLPYWTNHFECEKSLQQASNNKLGPSFSLHKSFVCAGGDKEDTCVGDGGAPLVCPIEANPKQYVQVGVTSWGLQCGIIGVPGVYASILESVDWIARVAVSQFGQEAYDYFLV